MRNDRQHEDACKRMMELKRRIQSDPSTTHEERTKLRQQLRLRDF